MITQQIRQFIKQIIYEIKIPRVSDDKFIAAWESSSSIPEVADKLGIAVNFVDSKARSLRRDKGVALKSFKPKHTLDRDKFARVWNASEKAKDVAVQFNLTITQACSVAAKMRRAGISMKAFPRGNPENDKDAFINAWNRSASLSDVIIKLKAAGIVTTKIHASNYAVALRRRGFSLKDFKQPNKYKIVQPKRKISLQMLDDIWLIMPDEKVIAGVLDADENEIKRDVEKLRADKPKTQIRDTAQANIIKQFIAAWNNATSMKDFIRTTLMNKDRALIAVQRLRSAGIDMKDLGDVSIAK